MPAYTAPVAANVVPETVSLRTRLLATAMGCTALMLSAPAAAQQAPVSAQQNGVASASAASDAQDEPIVDPAVVSDEPVVVVQDDDIFIGVGSIVIDEADTPALLLDSNEGDAQVVGGDIETYGDNSTGAWVEARGDANADFGEVVTHGDGSTGLYVHSEGKTVTSPYGYGEYTTGTAHAGAVSVETFGDDAIGIMAVADAQNVVVQNQDLVTHGDGSMGIVVDAGYYGMVDSGTVMTGGDDATGISISAQLAKVTTVSVVTEGDRSIGIDLDAGGSGLVDAGMVETSGDDATGIRARAGLGSLQIYTGSVVTAGDRSGGLDLEATGAIILESESIETSGDDAVGLRAASREYDLYAVVGSVATLGDGATGISVGANLDADLMVDTVSTAGDGANGIEMVTASGGATLRNGSVTTLGNDLTAILVESLAGRVDVETQSVSTAGDNARAIHLISGGNTRLVAGDVTTAGDGSRAVEINSQGDVEVAIDSITTTGDGADGLLIWQGSAGTDAVLDVGSVTIEGEGSYGVVAIVGGDVTGTIDTVIASGNGSTGVLMEAGEGIDLQMGSVDIVSERHSVGVELVAFSGDLNFAADSISVDSDGAAGLRLDALEGDIVLNVDSVHVAGGEVQAPDGYGTMAPAAVFVRADNGGITMRGGDIVVEAEDVYSTWGVSLAAQDHIDVAIDSIYVTGFTSYWEGSTGFGSGLGVTTRTSATVSVGRIDAGSGVKVTGATDTRYLDAEIAITAGDIITRANYGDGIRAAQFFGSTDIAFNSVRTEGDGAVGVEIESGFEPTFYTATTAQVTGGSIETVGDDSQGMNLISLLGSHSAEVESIKTTGARSNGVFSQSVVGADLLIGSVETSGDYSIGIEAVGTVVPTSVPLGELEVEGISIEAGSVATSGDSAQGIVATGVGPVTIKVNSVETTGDSYVFEPGEYYGGGGGPIGPGLPLPGGVASDEPGDELPTGPASIGIEVAASFGDIVVEAGSVTTSGDGAHGLWIDLQGDEWSVADQQVTVASVQTSGAGADALRLRNQTGGAIAATVAGDVLAQDGTGINLIGNGETSVTVAAGGMLRSSADGFAIVVEPYVAEDPGDGPIDPNPPIPGGPGLPIGTTANSVAAEVAVPATNITIAGGGALYGRVRLDDRGSNFDIAGTFFANGTSYFGTGNDLMSNSGSIVVQGDVLFDGLDRLDNSGAIVFAAGNGDDRLDLSNLVFNGVEGSTISFDLSGDDSDQLVLGDVTGTTQLVFQGAQGLTLDSTADLIVFTGDVDTDAFVIDDGAEDAGFLNYRLSFAQGGLAVAMAPDVEVFEPVRLGETITDAWHQSTDAWAKQNAQARAGSQSGISSWVQYFDGSRDRDPQEYQVTFDGAEYAETLTIEASHRGGQGGITYAGSKARFGVTFGFGSNESTFAQTGNSYRVESFNIGLHGGWSNGAVFLDALVKADFADVDLALQSVGEQADFDTTALGFALEAGARLGGETFFVEPVAGINWVSADIPALHFTNAGFAFDSAESLRAHAGARTGARFETGKVSIVPHVGVFAEKELAGDNGIAFTSGTQSITLADEVPALYGRGEAGLTLEISDRFSIFAEGELLFGEIGGGAGRGGLSLKF